MTSNKSENPREKLSFRLLHSKWRKLATVMASVIVFVTAYALILPAITMSAQQPKCGFEGHTHTAECYDAEGNVICGFEEHVHTIACYSDLYADIENTDLWNAAIPGLSGERNADVVGVASSQLGYRESENNYLVFDGDQMQGYTRYGHWYGDAVDGSGERLANGLSSYAYANWDAMFVSFVLDHAGIDDMGMDSDAGNWTGALAASGKYAEAADYIPEAGDLIFYTPYAGAGVKVGLVTDVNRGFLGLFGDEVRSISVIAGDSDNSVSEVRVAVAEHNEGDVAFETIHGYGVLTPRAEEPEDVSVAEEAVDNSDVSVEEPVEAPADETTAAEAKMALDVVTVPSDESLTEAVPSEEAAVEEAPADESTAEKVPSDKSVAEEVPVEEIDQEEFIKAVPEDESVTEQATEAADDDAADQAAPEDEPVTEQTAEDSSEDSDADAVSKLEGTEHIIGATPDELDAVAETDDTGLVVTVEEASLSEDGTAIIMKWSAKTQLEKDTLPVGAIIRVDTATGKAHGLTASEAKAWAGHAVLGGEDLVLVDNDNYEVTFIGSNDLLYTWADVQAMEDGAVTTFTGIHVKVLADVAVEENGEVALAFETTARLADANVGQNYYVTKVSVDGLAGSATYTYKNGEAVPVDQNKVLQDAGLEQTDEIILTAKGNGYTVTMTCGAEACVPEVAKLKVTEIVQGSEEYDAYLAEAKETLGEKAADCGLQGRFFDITIMTKDGEFTPKAPVKVDIQYTEAITDVDADDVSAVHFAKGGANEVSVETNENDGEISAVGFEAESFSVYGIVYTVDFTYEGYTYSIEGGSTIYLSELVEILGIVGEGRTYASGSEFVADVADVVFSDESLVSVSKDGFLGLGSDWILTSLQAFDTEETLTITMTNGETYLIKVTDALNSDGYLDLADEANATITVSTDEEVTTTDQERDASFDITVSYALTEEGLSSLKSSDSYTMVYDFSSTLTNSSLVDSIEDTSGRLVVGRTVIGSYEIIDNVVYIYITNKGWLRNRTNIKGSFTFTVQTDSSQLGDEDEETYVFPGDSDGITVTYVQKVEEGSKASNYTENSDGSKTIQYTATVEVNYDLDSLVFSDVLGGLQTVDLSTVKINGTSVSSFTSSGDQEFSFDVATALSTEGVSAGTYYVTYEATVSAEDLEAMTEDTTTEKNEATWTVNGNKEVPGGETSITFEKPEEEEETPDIEKSASPDSGTTVQPGDTITYTVTYGEEGEDVGGVTVSDYITDLVTIEGDISVTGGLTTTITAENGKTTYVTDSSYSTNTVTVFSYTIPEGTTGPVTFTYTATVIDQETATNNGIYDTLSIYNMAHESKSNKQPTTTHTVTYDKQPVVTVEKTADGTYEPGSTITYTITIGDSDTLLDNVSFRDYMTDVQILNADSVSMTVNGVSTDLPDGAIVYTDDGEYSATANVDVLDFTFPSGTGYGPAVITYTTTLISSETAGEEQIFGDVSVYNTGTTDGDSDSAYSICGFDNIDVDKDVQQSDEPVDGETVESGSTLHYVITFGDSEKLMDNIKISDYMTDLQKLSSAVTITLADGTSYTMPDATSQWSNDGVVWDAYYDDDAYSTSLVYVFSYTLPEGTGYGPITVEYDTTLITEEEANNAGIQSSQSVINHITVNNVSDETTVTVEYPTDPTHNPTIVKEFDHWDVDNNRVYWNIIVDKDETSAFPLTDITVYEDYCFYYSNDETEWQKLVGEDFDVAGAVVTGLNTGTTYSVGSDYTIDKEEGSFHFDEITEPIQINISFESPIDITNSYTAINNAKLNTGKTAQDSQTYTSAEIDATKKGVYDEDSKIVTWTVYLNSAKLTFEESTPYSVLFEDTLPEGHVLLNYSTKGTDDPSIFVQYYGNNVWYFQDGAGVEYDVQVTNNEIEAVDIALNSYNGEAYYTTGLSGERMVITYYTQISDEEWDEITSSVTGSKTYENNVTVTASDGTLITDDGYVTISEEDFIEKYDVTQEATGSDDVDEGVVIDAEGNVTSAISYKIVVNPNARVLVGDGKTLTLTDQISTNMDLDTDSVKILNEETGEYIEDDDGISISYEDDTRILTISGLPDSTTLIVTYDAYARHSGEDTYENTATLTGGGSHSAYVEESHVIQTSDATIQGGSLELTLHKIDRDKIINGLEGAVFELYRVDFTDVTEEDYAELYEEIQNNPTMEGYTNSKFSFENSTETLLGEYTTDEDGYIYWSAEVLAEQKLYYWVETQQPDGYSDDQVGIKHYFVVYRTTADESETDFDAEYHQLMAWALDDTVTNTNGVTVASMTSGTVWTATNAKYTYISATKEWDDEDNYYETRPTEGIYLYLYQIDAEGNETLMSDVSPVPILPDENGKWPTYTWALLPIADEDGNEYKYTVKEALVENYSTSYSDNGEGLTGGVITITNKMLPSTTDISIRKEFSPADIPKPEQVIFYLMEIDTYADGTVVGPYKSGYSIALPYMNEWEYKFEDLPTTGKDSDGNYYSITYTLEEKAVSGYNFVVTYSDGQEGVLEATEDDPLVVTNYLNGTVKVTKVFTGASALPDDFQITNDYNDEVFTVSNATSGDGSIYSPYEWTITDVPVNTSVVFTESGISIDGYSVTVTANGVAQAEGSTTASATSTSTTDTSSIAEFVNTYNRLLTDVDVTKVWLDEDGAETTWDDDVESITLYLTRLKGEELDDSFGESGIVTVIATKSEITSISPNLDGVSGTVTDNTEDGGGYIVKLEGLEKYYSDEDSGAQEYAYYFSEDKDKIAEQQYKEPSYESSSGEELTDAEKVLSGGTIYNTPESSYDLPVTGGSGTGIYIITGMLLLMFAAIGIVAKRKVSYAGISVGNLEGRRQEVSDE